MKFATHFCLSRFLRVWLSLILAICLLTAPAFATDAATSPENPPDSEPTIQVTTPPPPADSSESAVDPGLVPDENLTTDQENLGERPKNHLNAAAWITDESGRMVSKLYANSVYTVHVSVETVGDVTAEGAKIWIWSNALSDSIPVPGDDGLVDSYELHFGVIGDNVGYDDAQAEFQSASVHPLKAYYVSGSAQLMMAGEGGTVSVKDTELANYKIGAYLGYDAADGTLPVGREYTCELTFDVETELIGTALTMNATSQSSRDEDAMSSDPDDYEPNTPVRDDPPSSVNANAPDTQTPTTTKKVTNEELKTGNIVSTSVLELLIGIDIAVQVHYGRKNQEMHAQTQRKIDCIDCPEEDGDDKTPFA